MSYRIGEQVASVYCLEMQTDHFLEKGFGFDTEDDQIMAEFEWKEYECNAMFGPYLWLTLETEQDTPQNWAKIKKALGPYLLGIDKTCRHPDCGCKNRSEDTHCQACGQKL